MPIEQKFNLKCDRCDCHIEWSEGKIPYGVNVMEANIPPDWSIIMTGGKGAELICYKHEIRVW